MKRDKCGKVYLIGAGPGDPGLLTLRGKELLEQADVVIYDRLASPRLLDLASKDAEKIYVGKRIGCHAVDQDEINRLIVEKAKAGKKVVRLKGGDPFIFGRGGEEAQVLSRDSIPFEIVPGVTSAIAVPAYAGIPLTHRSYTASVTLITGHRKLDQKAADVDWEGLAMGGGTLVFLMGVTNLPFISKQLIQYGRAPETPVAVIRWGTTPFHCSLTGTLENIAEKVKESNIKPPAIIVVGDVVGLKDEIEWYEKWPLLGKRIVVTRTREQASELIRLLERRGAYCIECSTIAVKEPADRSGLDSAIKELPSYDWIIFTSTNAVSFFMKRLFEKGLDSRALGAARVGVIGAGTADALRGYHINPDLIPDEFKAESLLSALENEGVVGKKILIPRAKKAREVLPEGLRKLGCRVDVVTVYETVTRELDQNILENLTEDPVDFITFTSSSTVKNFFKLVPEEVRNRVLPKAQIACIGPITADTARQFGLSVSIMPGKATIHSLVEALEEAASG